MCADLLEISFITTYEFNYYLLDQGPFTSNRTLHSMLTGIWAAVEFLLPAAILLFCTTRLVQALRESRRIQRRYWAVIHSTTGMTPSETGSERGRHLTATLVAIVVFFLVLVTPSELLHLCYYVVRHDNAPSFELALVIANVLQTANFALNFLLYCVCNSQFRDTWKHLTIQHCFSNNCNVLRICITGRLRAVAANQKYSINRTNRKRRLSEPPGST